MGQPERLVNGINRNHGIQQWWLLARTGIHRGYFLPRESAFRDLLDRCWYPASALAYYLQTSERIQLWHGSTFAFVDYPNDINDKTAKDKCDLCQISTSPLFGKYKKSPLPRIDWVIVATAVTRILKTLKHKPYRYIRFWLFFHCFVAFVL